MGWFNQLIFFLHHNKTPETLGIWQLPTASLQRADSKWVEKSRTTVKFQKKTIRPMLGKDGTLQVCVLFLKVTWKKVDLLDAVYLNIRVYMQAFRFYDMVWV